MYNYISVSQGPPTMSFSKLASIFNGIESYYGFKTFKDFLLAARKEHWVTFDDKSSEWMVSCAKKFPKLVSTGFSYKEYSNDQDKQEQPSTNEKFDKLIEYTKRYPKTLEFSSSVLQREIPGIATDSGFANLKVYINAAEAANLITILERGNNEIIFKQYTPKVDMFVFQRLYEYFLRDDSVEVAKTEVGKIIKATEIGFTSLQSYLDAAIDAKIIKITRNAGKTNYFFTLSEPDKSLLPFRSLLDFMKKNPATRYSSLKISDNLAPSYLNFGYKTYQGFLQAASDFGHVKIISKNGDEIMFTNTNAVDVATEYKKLITLMNDLPNQRTFSTKRMPRGVNIFNLDIFRFRI